MRSQNVNFRESKDWSRKPLRLAKAFVKTIHLWACVAALVGKYIFLYMKDSGFARRLCQQVSIKPLEFLGESLPHDIRDTFTVIVMNNCSLRLWSMVITFARAINIINDHMLSVFSLIKLPRRFKPWSSHSLVIQELNPLLFLIFRVTSLTQHKGWI